MFRSRILNLFWAIGLFAAVVLIVYQPWTLKMLELQRTEGLIVAEAMEYKPLELVVSAHGMRIPGAYPLFPALGYAVQHYLLPTLSMPFILRLISLAALVLSAVTAGVAAASVRDLRAGLVAAAVYLTSLISIEKSCEGMAATLAALPVLLGQLLFFHFAIRKNRWNMAWFAALVLAALAFLVDGFQALLYFFFPFFFFRRPLSVRDKFHYPGFWAGALLTGSVIVLYLEMTHRHAAEMHSLLLFWNELSLGNYLLTLLTFPFRIAGRLFPWILIAWFPFCVALQSLDETPIFGRYLRTLTLPTLALLWLHPDIDPRNVFYLLGPLAIQIGMYYELGVRRYGHRVLKTGPLLETFALLIMAVFLLSFNMPQKLLDQLAALMRADLGLNFLKNLDKSGAYFWHLVAAVFLLTAIAALIHALYRNPPPKGYRTIWGILLGTAVCCGLINSLLLRPYRAQNRERRNFAAELMKLLSPKPDKLYKNKIVGLYAELYYAGIPKIHYLDTVTQLPAEEKEVYLMSAVFPEQPSREWSNLGSISYRDKKFFLWKGTLRKEEALSTDNVSWSNHSKGGL